METYHTDTCANRSRKPVEYIDCGIEPFGQSIMGTAGVVRVRDLSSEQSEDGVGRIAGFEFGKYRVGMEIFVGFPLVSDYCIVKDSLIV